MRTSGIKTLLCFALAMASCDPKPADPAPPTPAPSSTTIAVNEAEQCAYLFEQSEAEGYPVADEQLCESGTLPPSSSGGANMRYDRATDQKCTNNSLGRYCCTWYNEGSRNAYTRCGQCSAASGWC